MLTVTKNHASGIRNIYNAIRLYRFIKQFDEQGVPGYRVSSLGDVISLNRNFVVHPHHIDEILSALISAGGYFEESAIFIALAFYTGL